MRRELTRRQWLASFAAAQTPRTNVVLILTDNHGAWTLGCYGNPDVRTPNIDRLAKEGVLFTRAFSNNAVCSPTRASLLTGLMPSQHGVHRYLAAGGAQIGPRAYNTISEFRTLPKILTDAGYAAGLCGKWHLGANPEPQEGFRYWVTMPHGASPGFYDQEILENGRVRRESQYLTDFWTDHGSRFIEQNRAWPFFLMLSYNGPYGLGGAAKEPVRNRHAAYYAQHELPSFPRDAPHPWLFNNRDFMRDPAVRRKYAAEISGIDDGVGRILETLDRLSLRNDTLVLFMADQGLACGQSGFWGMGDHTRPLTAFDWTMSIPMIFSHPGKIPAGRRLGHMTSTYDVLPALLDYLGLADRQPRTLEPPGRSFAPLLGGETLAWDNTVYFEFENVRAIRTGQWKCIERIHEGPNELYDLRQDPGERLNLFGQPAVEKVNADLRQRLHAFFARHADPKWDLWKGGKSKSGLITG
ncbi:MAG: sulfatase-like hydrolase/transferase, partial [Acidobacteria bacterium]|nr:sulfatase-like hydrolase/transferase [Acidobacteriota bacterium]